MNNKIGLKYLSGSIVYESKRLTPGSKIQLLNFIKEADEHQLMSFLLDHKLDKIADPLAAKILEKRFENSMYADYLHEIMPKLKTYASQAGMGAYLAPWLVYRKVRSMYDECTKKCGTYEINSIRRQVCMVKCNIRRTELLIKGNVDVEKNKLKLHKLQGKLKEYEAQFKKRGAEM